MLQAVESFLDFLAFEKGYSPHTLAAYRNDLGQFVKYLQDEYSGWEEVHKDVIVNYILHLQERGYVPTTVARKIASLKSFYRFMEAEGRIPSDPTATLDTPKVGRQLPRALSPEEMEKLLAEPAKEDGAKALRDSAILELLYATGMRVSELVSLNLDNVDLERGTVRCVGKGSKERIIPVHDEAVRALEAYLGKGRGKITGGDNAELALFLNLRGTRLTRQGLWLIVKQYAQAAGIGRDITPHVLRHSFATHVLAGGLNLRQVQELLGHRSISTTQVYTQVTSERRREAFEKAHPRAS
jgi:integrase/recombinase XerD